MPTLEYTKHHHLTVSTCTLPLVDPPPTFWWNQVTLMEMLDSDDFPIAPMLGTGTSNANGLNVATPQMWMDRVSAHAVCKGLLLKTVCQDIKCCVCHLPFGCSPCWASTGLCIFVALQHSGGRSSYCVQCKRVCHTYKACVCQQPPQQNWQQRLAATAGFDVGTSSVNCATHLSSCWCNQCAVNSAASC